MTKDPCKVGDRIRLLEMQDDPDPIPPGTTGTVTSVHQFRGLGPRLEGAWHISVNWDVSRSLALCYPPDHFEVLHGP
jgi:hypothetical protein